MQKLAHGLIVALHIPLLRFMDSRGLREIPLVFDRFAVRESSARSHFNGDDHTSYGR